MPQAPRLPPHRLAGAWQRQGAADLASTPGPFAPLLHHCKPRRRFRSWCVLPERPALPAELPRRRPRSGSASPLVLQGARTLTPEDMWWTYLGLCRVNNRYTCRDCATFQPADLRATELHSFSRFCAREQLISSLHANPLPWQTPCVSADGLRYNRVFGNYSLGWRCRQITGRFC